MKREIRKLKNNRANKGDGAISGTAATTVLINAAYKILFWIPCRQRSLHARSFMGAYQAGFTGAILEKCREYQQSEDAVNVGCTPTEPEYQSSEVGI